MRNYSLLLILFCLACHAKNSGSTSVSENSRAGRLEALISKDIQMEVLARGFGLTEGPLWVNDRLLFSDVPGNTIYQWSEKQGVKEYLKTSGGIKQPEQKGQYGSNGLLLDSQNRLVLCQHGMRQVARMHAPLDDPAPDFVTLAGHYKGKRFNSPNDAVYNRKGVLYFTDPPYGLAKGEKDPAKELDFQGVYTLDKQGQVMLLTKALSRPNGIAFSADESKLYVSNSDPEHAVWMEYEVKEDGALGKGKVFFDATEYVKKYKNLPDGLKVGPEGKIYATGPGGLWIFSPKGEPLSLIRAPGQVTNCAFNEDYTTLYITGNDMLARVQLIKE